MSIISSDEDMRRYCMEQLANYDFEQDDEENEDVESCTLEQLISITVREGNNQIDTQLGWVLRHVVRGTNMVEMH